MEDSALQTLAPGWVRVRLGDLGTWTGGGTPSKSRSEFWSEGTIPWVSPKDMKAALVGSGAERITKMAVAQSAAKLVPLGSVLCVVRSGILKHSFPVAIADQAVTLNQDMRAITPSVGISADYIRYYLCYSNDDILHQCAKDGTTVASIEQRCLNSFLIPLPPTNEQTRIVAAVKELFEEIETGEAALARARENLTQFRASVLHAACTGALTADWRAANPSNETGEDVIRLSQRAAGSLIRGKLSSSLPTDLPDDLPQLPSSWRWVPLWRLCEIIGGITVDAKRSGEDLVDVPYLRVANVQRGRLDLGTLKTLKASPDQIARLALRPNDILLNEGGDRDKLGRGWVWEGQVETCIHQNHVFRARPYLPGLDGRFISHYLNELGRNYFFKKATQTVNLASISLRTVLAVPIPVPPLPEITEIVRRITEIETAAFTPFLPNEYGSQLRQSILHAAFTGRLVPQDPADEPAEALLARLRATPTPARRPRPRRGATQPDLIETEA